MKEFEIAPPGYKFVFSKYRTVKGKRIYKADGGTYRFLVKI
ncbi:hypothetical protein [Flavobacterium sufflavum]|nr:hypothetical protein [Flavobacterium sufflavum]